MNDMTNAVKYYKDVLHEANMNVEAIACIATNYFYTDQPEIALKFYRLGSISFSRFVRFLANEMSLNKSIQLMPESVGCSMPSQTIIYFYKVHLFFPCIYTLAVTCWLASYH